MNFVSFLAIYSGEELPYTVFVNTTNTALNKLTHFMEEQSIEMVRSMMTDIEELSDEYNLKYSLSGEQPKIEKLVRSVEN